MIDAEARTLYRVRSAALAFVVAGCGSGSHPPAVVAASAPVSAPDAGAAAPPVEDQRAVAPESPPAATLGSTGQLLPDDIAFIAIGHTQQVRRDCWDSRTVDGGGDDVNVTIEFAIDAVGRVTQASARSEDAEVGECVAKEVRSWTFPPSSAGAASVALPFRFTRGAATQSPAGRTKDAACSARGPLPDPACTPGAVKTTDREAVCRPPARVHGQVSAATRDRVFAAYGLSGPQPASWYELDRLIPLELGGDDVIANLWPQPAAMSLGSHEKDCVEDYLRTLVCAGHMSLEDAQRAIAADWVAVDARRQAFRNVEDGSDARCGDPVVRPPPARVRVLQVGEKCTESVECRYGFLCARGVCVSGAPLGARCKVDDDCGFGLTCMGRKCVPAPPPPVLPE